MQWQRGQRINQGGYLKSVKAVGEGAMFVFIFLWTLLASISIEFISSCGIRRSLRRTEKKPGCLRNSQYYNSKYVRM